MQLYLNKWHFGGVVNARAVSIFDSLNNTKLTLSSAKPVPSGARVRIPEVSLVIAFTFYLITLQKPSLIYTTFNFNSNSL